MKIHYLATGDELLDGRVVNTNLQYIAQEIYDIGLQLHKSVTIGDDKPGLVNAIKELRLDADVFIITGGLGPTDDDRTTEALAETLLLPLIRDKESELEIKSYFESKNRPFYESNLKQADFPKGASIIANTIGTAPGYILEKGGCTHIVLPGVPREMKLMFANTVLPMLLKKMPPNAAYRKKVQFRLIGCGESEAADALKCLYPLPDSLNIGYRAKIPEIHVTLTVSHSVQEMVDKLVKEYSSKIIQKLKKWVFTTYDKSFLQHFVDFLRERNDTISCAESCTGGMCSEFITSIPGASDILSLSLVTYSNQSKVALCDVSSTTLEKYGAVSKETAKEMVEGVLRLSNACHAISITGIAGPDGGTNDKPVGTVFIGIKTPKSFFVKRLVYSGTRDMIRNRSAYHALYLLYTAVLSDETAKS